MEHLKARGLAIQAAQHNKSAGGIDRSSPFVPKGAPAHAPEGITYSMSELLYDAHERSTCGEHPYRAYLREMGFADK